MTTARMHSATLMGLISLLIWSSLVGVVKLMTESLSPVLSIAMIYSISAWVIFCSCGRPKWQQMPKIYLWGCGGLFVAYEILFLLAISLTTNRDQVLLVTMINYLWPPLTILFSIFLKQVKARWYVILGFIMTVIGLMVVIYPDVLAPEMLFSVLRQNPIAYTFAFLAALIWPAYCVFTKRYAEGHNAVSLFFIVSACGLWLIHFVLGEAFTLPSPLQGLGILLIGGCIGFAYYQWNQSMQYGNLQVLICATYFMPILSSLISMQLLDLSPVWSFWMGTVLVSLGACVCWYATRE